MMKMMKLPVFMARVSIFSIILTGSLFLSDMLVASSGAVPAPERTTAETSGAVSAPERTTAETSGTVPAPGKPVENEEIESKLRAIASELRCLQCPSQSLIDSESPFAKDIMKLIKNRLVSGESDQEIIEFLVSRYGQFILLRPRLTGTTAFLWFSPFVLLVMGCFWLWRATYSRNRVKQQ